MDQLFIFRTNLNDMMKIEHRKKLLKLKNMTFEKLQ